MAKGGSRGPAVAVLLWGRTVGFDVSNLKRVVGYVFKAYYIWAGKSNIIVVHRLVNIHRKDFKSKSLYIACFFSKTGASL